METDYNDLLDNLAFRLEVPLSHMWEVLITQSYISAFTNTFVWVLTIVFTAILVSWVTKHPEYLFDNPSDKASINGYGFSAYLTIGILMLCVSASFISASGEIVTQLVNPEYWALQHLLTLKP